MKNKRPTFTHPSKMQGFSLIEFLVASALSLIVLIAVTSIYFTARSLNSTATARLSVQQDLRNASTLLVRDARMAGSFGCFNMANHGAASIVSDGSSPPFNLASNPGKDSLIPIAETTALTYSGFSLSGSALVFQYGIEDNNRPANLAVASSCTGIAKSSTVNNLTTAKAALKITGDEKNGEISFLKHIVIAYAAGTINGQQGLYRFQLSDSGYWGDPQLLIKDITSMNMEYLYVNDCPDNIAASSPALETFTKGSLQTGTNAVTPALVKIRLNSGNAIEASADNSVQVYNIDATVRGGNVCADRTI